MVGQAGAPPELLTTPSFETHTKNGTAPLEALACLYELIRPIREWCVERRDRVSEGYIFLTPSDAYLYIVGTQPKYDFELRRELSSLTSDLNAKNWPVDAMLIPACSADELTNFVDPSQTLRFFRA